MTNQIMSNQIIENYKADAIATFRNYKLMAEKSVAQISDDEFFHLTDAKSNSVAIMVKHIAGNLTSRFTDFLTTDGEKPSRNRDGEFDSENDSRESLMKFWEQGWQVLFDSIEPLTVEDFAKSVPIRGQPHTICEAINRQMTHYAYHIGQIAFLAKHFRAKDWKTLSVPRGQSGEFNAYLTENKDKAHYLDATQDFADKK